MSVPTRYSLGERILRTMVFQVGVSAGYLESSLIWMYKACSKFSIFQTVLDEKKAESTLNTYIRLGANIEFLTPRDGLTKIQTMHLKAKDLEQILLRLGARWEKIQTGENQSILAIIPPDNTTEDWNAFEKDLLKLKWKKRLVSINERETREVIVTCENAENIESQDWNKRVFLHANSASVSFI